ncbi:MAG: late competence development ComFB family protein [Candidatus Riflebacteria bacterium]|nr:late competence development ComFB family protein [Candidatus Riflebacteria bacterium]
MTEVFLNNRMEVFVRNELEVLKAREADICTCERCLLDVIALALNALPSRYVVTKFGEIAANLELESSQYRADVTVALLKALEKVRQKPRH